MPRPLKGHIIERHLDDGRLAFDVKIRKRQVLVGYSPEWSPARVQRLLDNRLIPRAKLQEPWWEEIPGVHSQNTATSGPVWFEDVAAQYLDRIDAQYTNASTRNAARSPVEKHVGPFFSYDGDRLRAVTEITGELVSRFTKAKQHERDVLLELADMMAGFDGDLRRDPDLLRDAVGSEEHWSLLARYGQRSGRLRLSDALAPDSRGLISLSSRGLSNGEINRCLARLRDILDLAREEHQVDIGDPTRKRSLPANGVDRSWLLPAQLQAIFDAAGDLDAHTRYGQLGRRGLVKLLGLNGPRVTEVCEAQWFRSHLDGDDPFLRIPKAKTNAGERDLWLHPPVHQELVERRSALNPDDEDFIYSTAAGKRRDDNSIRNRILGPVVTRAKLLLRERKQPPLPDRVTPHTFRRTYLTYLAWANAPMSFAKHQAGHKYASVLVEIYQQNFPRDPAARAQVVEWLGQIWE